MRETKGPVVAITGGTRGIGRAVADLFRSRGYGVAVCSRSVRDASLPSDIMHGRVDVRKRKELQRFVEQLQEQLGAMDVMVNCAGVSRWRPVEEIDEGFVEEVIETIEGAASCALYPVLKRPDEKWVTEKAYDNPRFVEDMVREIALAFDADGRYESYEIEVENDESIHAHNAYAYLKRP